MMDEINTEGKERFFSEEAQAHIISATKFVLSKLYESGSKCLETRIGVNPKAITDGLAEIHANAEETLEVSNEYDEYFAFKQARLYLRDRLQEIASERTVVFVVDELDRCIPEYQIKVLERLHHIFNGIDNMQVILAVDKMQLERTIQKMFGDHVDTQKYLAKFIKFEIELDEGKYSHQFEDALEYYFNQFVSNDENDERNIIEFKKNIFSGIAVRERIEIVEKCHLLHSVLCPPDKSMDVTILCAELFLTIIVHTRTPLPIRNRGLRFENMFGNEPTAGLKFLQEKLSRKSGGFYGENRAYYHAMDGKCFIAPSDLWGVLLGCYAIIAQVEIHGYSNNRPMMIEVEDHVKQFWLLLKTIK